MSLFFHWISEIQAIGWDLDGTLYKSDSRFSRLIRSRQLEMVVEKKGWDIEKARTEFDKLYVKLGSHTKVLNTLGLDGDGFYRKFWDEAPLERYLKKDDRLIQLFERLKTKRHFLITNSNTHDQIKKKLGLIGIDYVVFEVVVSSFDVGENKPSLKPFAEALRQLKLYPTKTVYIGDREKTDIIPAKKKGMRTCLVWGESEEADISLATVYDVGSLFYKK